jgi:iron complex outermembrane receptor protein
VTQFLSIPVAAQFSPLSGGGVVALASPFGGLDLRWTSTASAFGKPLEFVFGSTYDLQNQHRQGYENFLAGTLGVEGALRRDEQDRVAAFDQYAQATWNPGGRWSLFAGLRHSDVRFQSSDHFVTASNPDDSGHLAFDALTPVAGVVWRLNSVAHAYVSYGDSFETPTFDELGYRPDGTGGFNFALRPARSRNGEAGLKLDFAKHLRIDAALFRADTRDELAADTSVGGRTTYQNVGDARRQGMELAMNATLGWKWHARLAYTYLDARFRDAFLTCAGTPCAVPTTLVAAGTRIPGVPRSFASASATWGGTTGLQATLDAQYVGSLSVNNAATDRTSAYSVFDARVAYEHSIGHGSFRTFAGIDNLFDRRYAGSVIVNESNQRNFEPAPGRTFVVGIDVRIE